jgi:hypothetical protein
MEQVCIYKTKDSEGKTRTIITDTPEQAKRLHRLGAQGMSREYNRVLPQFHALVELTNLEGDDKNKVKKILLKELSFFDEVWQLKTKAYRILQPFISEENRNLFEMRLEAIS